MSWKEARQILRSPSTLFVAFVLPAVLLFLMGFGINLDSTNTKVGIAMQDQSAAARSLASAYEHSRFFDVRMHGPVRQLEPELVAGSIRGIIVIPGDFGANAARGGGTVQIITDGSMPNTARFVAAFADGIYADWAAERANDLGQGRRPSMSMSSRFWFNPGLTSRNFLVPGSIAVVMAIIGSLLTALVVAREWERGTMEALMATPLRMSELLLSKVICYMALGLVSMAMCTLLAVTLFDVPLRGSLLSLLAISAVYLVPALGQGLLISAALKSQYLANQIALLTAFLPTMLLSGFIFEIASMPEPIQWITFLVPARYLIPQLETVFLAGDEWTLFLPYMAILLAFGAVLFALCMRAMKRRIA